MARGRKRKLGKREPNGRLSRRRDDVQARQGETEAETLSTALEARARLYGLPEKFLRDDRAGTVVGRMNLQDELSGVQYRAAVKWMETRSRYHKALLARGETTGGGTRGTPELVSDEYIGWVRRAVEQWDEASMVLIDLSVSLRTTNVSSAMTWLVERDTYVAGLTGDLRLALNALAKHWGLDTSREAA